MLKTLRAQRYMRLLDRLEGELTAPPTGDQEPSLERIAGDEFERLAREMAELGPDPADTALHDARKTTKRARYAAELAERARGRKATRFIAATKLLQDVLGDHQDAAVAERTIRELAEGAPRPKRHSPPGCWPSASASGAASRAPPIRGRGRRYASAAGPPGRDPADPARSGRKARCLGR